MDKVNFIEFYKQFIIFSDQVLPSISPVEHPILFNIFSHSIAMGKTTCRLSYADLHQLTGLSLPTIKKALRSLLDKGMIRLVNMASARIPRTYELIWPENVKHHSKLERNPDAVISSMYLGGKKPSGIIDRLTQEDKDMLNILISSLTKDEESEYKEIAAALATQYDDKDKLFREIVAHEKFGKLRLMKYKNPEPEETGAVDK